MALYHFTVTQISRSGGSSAIASAAYRSGQKLHSERYNEDNDYTRKGGVVMSEILLPPNAPTEYADRETLWNSVEAAERRNDAQLAYSFEFSLQNEFTLEENEALARQFIQDNFVSRGMIADFAIHDPDRGEQGNHNPHVHVMCPMRPLNEDGSWGSKQKRIVLTDENGEVIWDEKKNCPKYTAVRTTDWSEPETLEQWRCNWADLCNAKFAEKGMDMRIDNRSYERQGIDQIPQIHEGPTVRAMERKGIPTEKGAFNRWVRASNEMLKSIRSKLSELVAWIEETREILAREPEPSLKMILMEYTDLQKEGAKQYSKYGRQKAAITNLKDVTAAMVFLTENKIDTVEQLRAEVDALNDHFFSLQDTLKIKRQRIIELRNALEQVDAYSQNLPVFREMLKPKYNFKKTKDAYKAAHNKELAIFYRARRVMKEIGLDGPLDVATVKLWKVELSRLQQEYNEIYVELTPLRERMKTLSHIKYCVDRVNNSKKRKSFNIER